MTMTIRLKRGTAADDRDDYISVDVPLTPSGCHLPFSQVDPENQEVGEFNQIFSDHDACVKSTRLEAVA